MGAKTIDEKCGKGKPEALFQIFSLGEGRKILLVVVPNFSTTSEFAILSTDTNGIPDVTGVSLEIKL